MATCSVCLEPYDAAERRPKVLPCGHTLCLRCVRRLPQPRRCSVDRKLFQTFPDRLPDNYALLEMIATRPEPASAAPKLWCRACSGEAGEQCVDEHPEALSNLKKARLELVQQPLDGLQTGAAALQSLCGVVDAALAWMPLFRQGLADRATGLGRMRQQLQAALGADEAVFEEARQAAAPDELAMEAALLLPALQGDMAMEAELSVSVRSANAAWTASCVSLAEQPAASLMLCQLLATGALRREQGQALELLLDADAPRWPERSNAAELDGEAMAARMAVGSRVVRGAHWPADSTADGTPPRPGTVVALDDDDTATVEWDCGGVGRYTMTPLADADDADDDDDDDDDDEDDEAEESGFQLKLLPRAPSVTSIFGISGPAFLDVSTISRSLSIREKTDLLADGQLDEVRALVGLHCDVSPSWSRTVLGRAAPRLEALGLTAAGDAQHAAQLLADHLAVVARAAPALEALFVSPVDTAAMNAALALPGLTHLEAYCPFEAPLGALRLPSGAVSKLKWLRLGVYPLRAALSVIRAHAATLEKLTLVTASSDPHGCPDLAAELRRCGLSKLRTLVLRRESDVEFCRHDEDSCREQVLRLFDMFLGSGLTVKVKCMECKANAVE